MNVQFKAFFSVFLASGLTVLEVMLVAVKAVIVPVVLVVIQLAAQLVAPSRNALMVARVAFIRKCL